jgi:asparagine synthase (glutamine-hydrolysing)
MCGIAGFFNLNQAPADPSVLERMTTHVRHRGPDDTGAIVFSLANGTVAEVSPGTPPSAEFEGGIGFQRLKILDLSQQGHQPMMNADRSIVLAFNGEVYNAFDYTAELEAAGYRFHSKSDTEVILYLYERYGLQGMLDRLNGMFAIAIADLRSRELHLVRDHLGIKPLYWTVAGSTLLFASEAKAFLAHPAFKAELDAQHVDELLAFRYVAGEASILKGVQHLRPGHWLRVTPDGMTATRYWSIPDWQDKASVRGEQAVDQLDELLRKSVASQLLSDVKVGCQLSGGVDSSLVTMSASQHFSADMETFSIVFADPLFSEQKWIDQVTARAKVDSHRTVFTEDFFLDTIERATWHMDQPISHPNSLGIWLLSQTAKGKVTVLLSGEGTDEVFGGYTRFYYAHMRPLIGPAWRGLRWVPGVGKRLAPHFDGDPVEAFITSTQFLPSPILSKLRPDANLAPSIARRRKLFDEGKADHLSNCLKYEMQTYMVDLLVRQDKMTMAHSLENRVPFLDRNVVEFARRLPAECLVGTTAPTSAGRMRGTKVVVKELARRTFDDEFVYRRKSGFGLPLAQYFRHPRFVDLMESRLLPGMQARGIVDAAVVRRMWRRALSAPATTESFWTIVSLELFAQRFVDGHSA